ncbi:MAG: N-acetylmuramoyl-L-alanine amidase [Armatimonadetes bacterium]|nr:N-acetylmuramoyl-L-alanine amidase [Armatimonadota bacterium]
MAVALLVLAVGWSAAGAQVVVTKTNDCAVRAGPGEEYDRICVLPPGVRLWAMGLKSGWYHVRLCPALDGWVDREDATATGDATPPSPARLGSVSVRGAQGGSTVAFELTYPVPFRIIPSVQPASLQVDLFGCVSASYWVRQFPGDQLCRLVQPMQFQSEWVRVTVPLRASAIVGYLAAYEGNSLIIRIRRPFDSPTLSGKTIVLDPGHGGADSGATGPGGLQEKTVNLDIALRAAEVLRAQGASVVLTRTADASVAPPGSPTSVELEARRLVATRAGADIFVSIHNNSVDGAGARNVAGTEAYYWTAFSQPLARHLSAAVSAALGTQNRFVASRPFSVLRSTDCPRALVECAYLSNPDEAAYMARPEFRARAAEGIVAGIRDYISEVCTGL